MNILEVWLVYLIVLILAWIILEAVTCFQGLSHGTKLFLALLIGLIILLFFIPTVDFVCPDDKFWYCLLLIVAILAPIIIGLWLLFNGGWNTMRRYALQGDDCDTTKINRTYVCNGPHCYEASTEVVSRTGKTTLIHC
jgi:hypothetical protein